MATKLDEANAAEAAGADAVIAKGYETGGWIGEEGSFVLLQRLLDGVSAPVWARRDRPAHGSGGVRGWRCRCPARQPAAADARVPAAGQRSRAHCLHGRQRDCRARIRDRCAAQG
ncbi:nitronate monooxygenase, partial [Streptomyces sp. DSM 44915]